MSTIVFGGGEAGPPPYPFPPITPGGLILTASSITLALNSGPTSPVVLRVYALAGADGNAPTWVQRADITLNASPLFLGGCGTFPRYPVGSSFYAQTGKRLIEKPLYRFGMIDGPLVATPDYPPAPPTALGYDSVTALFVAIASGQPVGSLRGARVVIRARRT